MTPTNLTRGSEGASKGNVTEGTVRVTYPLSKLQIYDESIRRYGDEEILVKSALVQIRVDDDVKHDADALFQSLGMDTATAVRMFLIQALQTGGLPFSVTRQPRYNGVTEAAMDEATAMAEGKTEARTYDSFAAYRQELGV